MGGEQGIVAEHLEVVTAAAATATGPFAAAPASPTTLATNFEQVADGELRRESGHSEPVQRPGDSPVHASLAAGSSDESVEKEVR